MVNKANEAFVLENVELYFTKVDPQSPVAITADGKTGWETQLRTKSKEEAKHWRSLSLNVKAVREDKDDEDSKIIFWKTTLRKKQFNSKGLETKAPQVVGGDLSEVDPTTIGNGSVANVRVFQYDYAFKPEGGGLQEGVGSVLMSMQITELLEYVPQNRESAFTVTKMKRVSVAEQQGEQAPVKESQKSNRIDDDEIPF